MTDPSAGAPKRFCTSCGSPLSQGAAFCTGCGASAEPAPAPQLLAPDRPAATRPPGAPVTAPPTQQVPLPTGPTTQQAPPGSMPPGAQPMSPPGQPPKSRSNAAWIIPLVVVGAVAIVGLGTVVALAFMGDDGSEKFEAVGDEVDASSDPGGDVDPITVVTPAPTSPPTTRPTTTSTTTRGFSSSGIFYGNEASLRTQPVATDNTFIRFVGNEAKDILITIHGVQDDGWYDITIQGDRGWVFGTFIQPSADGFDVAETRSGDRVTLRRSDGTPSGEDNPSLNAVLVVDHSGPYWEVVLPDGRAAWVSPDEMDFIG